MGPGRITRHDVHAFERDEGVSLDPWERRAVFDLDTAWLVSTSDRER